MQDPEGHTTTFQFEGGVPIYDPWAAYSFGSMLREARYPEGDQYLAEYNGPFKSLSKETYKAKPGSGLPDLVKTYNYGPCHSPGTTTKSGTQAPTTDPRGHPTPGTNTTPTRRGQNE